MVTLLEDTIGIDFKNENLRSAVLTHKSNLPVDQALERYGYCQQHLALLGDTFLHNFVHNDPRFKPQHRFLESNFMMYLWIKSMGLETTLELGDSPLNFVQYIKAYGSYFEAIVYAIWITKGRDEAKKFILESYLTRFDLLHLLQMKYDSAKKSLDNGHSFFSSLFYKVGEMHNQSINFRAQKNRSARTVSLTLAAPVKIEVSHCCGSYYEAIEGTSYKALQLLR